jgi:ABC-type transport system involved in cytochrome bd biosynthesis fused ATPase/permease subunit
MRAASSRAFRGSTTRSAVLLITHRPAHPADVDQVVRLHDGRVVSR